MRAAWVTMLLLPDAITTAVDEFTRDRSAMSLEAVGVPDPYRN